ncbi:glycosyltransferase family 4 protein [Castellaniella defragrans]|uniref:glycosyltransferase family 4 protein n=1 Tax=Castellaniella defragrans TaxID=75697 RepID=UPI0023F1F520|nr:glycosyltransferase family 4 protein [Castellaniella defragrans]
MSRKEGAPSGSPGGGRGRGGRRLRILTWHVHGNYLHALTQLPHDFVIPVLPGDPPGYATPGPRIPWGPNVHPVPAREVCREALDCVIYQSRAAFERDRLLLLTPEQRALPCAYIEHNPPEPHPTGTVHWFRHERGVLVHVTPHNALMWDCADVRTQVIEHGLVAPPRPLYTGERPRGIVVVNHLGRRGRRVGADLYQWAARQVPLDLIGMGSEELVGGRGEVPNMEVAAYMGEYRFFFSPIRYASLGLSLVEAMMAGLPIVGVAATELPCVIANGVNGWVDSQPQRLVACMRQLIDEPALARRWGQAARETALRRFSIERYIGDWNELLAGLVGGQEQE